MARNFADKVESELTGTFEAISLGDITGLSCMLDRVTSNSATSDFRYNKDGRLTSITRVTTAKTQRNFAWFKDKPVVMFDGDQYAVFTYTSNRVSEVKKYTLWINSPELTDHEKFTYNSNGELISQTYVLAGGGSICYNYQAGNVVKAFICELEDEAYNLLLNYDTKNNPWQLVNGSLTNETAIATYLGFYFGGPISKNNVGKFNDTVPIQELQLRLKQIIVGPVCI